ncbi:hypothetical protein PR202_gb04528 [Eleusine coracana subsp. coracana]|uniref:Uncharacterized protein n=1 Tax=Eleusine coracana subsp. coracana TaxID=191504 RepID=A0AAV5E422_ELECO|nr:hypothetical protein PR202_gb04528 [Eleusine coracana subsp. coracana]
MASMVHNYKHGFSGFAAMLTDDEAKQVAEFTEVISVEPSRMYNGATTRSWDFLGLSDQMPSDLLHKGRYGEDVIIGVIDTGIWPESRCFSDKGYGPVPSRWKGECVAGQAWNRSSCNNKIIGARFYSVDVDEEILKGDYLSPLDAHGHGTHTASTAAGSVVESVSFHGLAAGVARGGAPHARIAVYKALWKAKDGGSIGTTAALLAAIDDAIHDGVDVLSMSLTFPLENSFGTLHAVQKGITVVYAGGNDGPSPQTIANTAPWVITVAASKIDRSFPTMITLGNKQQIVGQSLYYQGKNSSRSSFRSLLYGDISPEVKVDPTRSITGKETLAPKVASFSSRGPSPDYPDIIKPDIAAPGANILAAKGNSYQIMSGTSMATPHVSGIIALLKVLHPNWSPAALKSAILTTASINDERDMPILADGLPRKIADPFDYGSGHIDPNRAADPGLIYDIDPRDYNKFLGCTSMKTFVSCNETSLPGYYLNLPSISVPDLRHPITISRTVTNVGEVDALYHAAIQSPPGVKMDVEPSILVFSATTKVITFQLYIVYLGDVRHGHPNEVVASHHDILSSVLGSKEDSMASMVHNYKHGFSGFAAMLTDDQAKQLAEFPEVISVEPSRMYEAATTRSWDFLGLSYQMPSDLLHKGRYGEDVIIGVVDSGIWPESRSFSDEGYGPVPSRWKGKCVAGQAWNRSSCNRKIIGARFYSVGVKEKILKDEYLSPRDANGHGTHTASTAAGSVVEAASFHGLASGFARGGAPHARIAVYKALWNEG